MSSDGSVVVKEFKILPQRTYKNIKVTPVQSVGEDRIKLYDSKNLNFIALVMGGKVIMSSLPNDGRYRWPLEVGKKWSTDFTFQMAGRKSFIVPKHYEVEAFENVTVPAGTFEAYRVMGVSGEAVKNTIRLWWAPKANMTIKIEHYKGKQRIISYETVSLPR